MKRNLTILLAIACVVVLVGCKKQEPAKAPTASGTDKQAQGMLDQAAAAVKTAKEEVKEAAQTVKQETAATVEEVKQAFTKEVDLNKSVADLKAEAEKMDVASLMQVAGKYKDAIVAKQGEFDAISKKMAAIPMTEKLGAEAQKLTGDAAKLTEAIKSLKDRFDIYVAALKAKGGDVSKLAM